jgi:PucR family transcriptional regulator, purine catabolism regulatory protein
MFEPADMRHFVVPITLHDVLGLPSLAAADPVVRTGRSRLSRLVRWVHTSELLDIAPLLRGGELMLVGGAGLAAATEADRRAYVRSLTAVEAAGLAVELGSHLPELPGEVVAEAHDCRLPVIELHRVVPFVEVTQEINGLLTNESVRRLQLADRVSHSLAAALADGSGVDELIRVLAAVSGAHAELTSTTGKVIAAARAGEPALDGPTPDEPVGPGEGRRIRRRRTQAVERAVVAPVRSGGVMVAMLSLTPGAETDLLLVDAAIDRAPEAVGLALLRTRPLSRVERDTHEFLSVVLGGREAERTVAAYANRVGLTDRDAYAGIVAPVNLRPAVITALETAMRRHSRAAVCQIRNGHLYAVVGLRVATDQLVEHRRRLVADLRDTPLPAHLRVAVGPPVRALADVHDSITVAKACVEHDGWGSAADAVMDCVDLSVPRFVHALRDDGALNSLVDDVLGELIAHDRRRGTALFDTLAAYLRYGSSKTECAKALHLQRQTLYQRLSRIFTVIGNPVPGSAEYGALLVAVEIETARRGSWARSADS